MSIQQNEEVLEALGLAIYSRNGWWRAQCPFCLLNTGKMDKRRSLGIHQKGAWHCFRCYEKGHLDEDVPEWIGDGTDHVEVEAPETFDPPEHFFPLWAEPGRSARTLEPARRYLLDRGLGPDVWHYAGIGACVDGDYKSRIIVPIYNVEGDAWIGYVGRLWYDPVPEGKLKYRYPPGMRRDRLFDHHLLFEETEEPVIVVEGVMDCLPYFGDAVACLGKPTKAHKEIFFEAKRPIAFCLDGDAWREAYALAMQLRLNGVRCGFVKLPPGQDPNTVPPEWLREQAKTCLEG